MKTLFELPSLFNLSGRPVTSYDSAEAVGNNACHDGSGNDNTCDSGSGTNNGCGTGSGDIEQDS